MVVTRVGFEPTITDTLSIRQSLPVLLNTLIKFATRAFYFFFVIVREEELRVILVFSVILPTFLSFKPFKRSVCMYYDQI